MLKNDLKNSLMNKIDSLETELEDDENGEISLDSLNFWKETIDTLILPPRISISSRRDSKIPFYSHSNEKKESRRLENWKFWLGVDAIENEVLEELIGLNLPKNEKKEIREGKNANPTQVDSTNQDKNSKQEQKNATQNKSNTNLYFLFLILIVIFFFLFFNKK